MIVQFHWTEMGCVAWHRAFTPWETREVEDDLWLELLKSHLFSEVKKEKKTEDKKQESKPAKSAK